MELQGAGQRVGAGACALAVAGFAILGTAGPASADDHRSGKHKAERQHKHPHPKAHSRHKASPPKAPKKKHVEAPSNKDETTTTLVRRPAVLLRPLLERGESTPALGPRLLRTPLSRPEAGAGSAPVLQPVPSVVLRPVRVARPQAAPVTAEALLDVTTVAPGRASLLRRQALRPAGPAARPLAQAATARAEGALAAVPRQLVDRAVPPIGTWPSGPVTTLPAGGDELPTAIALGGLVLALAAARGVSRMRHPRTDDPDLSFPTA